MNKRVRQAVEERAGGKCEVCGRPAKELHHIINGNGKRRQNERVETCIMLCDRCHDHNRAEKGYTLKRKLQSYYFQRGYDENQVRLLMGGKLYLKNGEIVKTETAEWLGVKV